MKATTQYNDLIGTAAADVADYPANSLEELGKNFGLDTEIYQVIGVTVYGVDPPSVSILCIEKSSGNKKKIHIDREFDFHHEVFKRMESVLIDKYYDNPENLSEHDFEETQLSDIVEE